MLFYAVSLFTAGIGESTAIIPDVKAMFWLPVGILLALLLIAPTRQWPIWIGASAAAELTANALWWQNPLLVSAGYATANVLHAITGTILMRRLLGRPAILSRPVHTALFVVVCGLVTPIISATVIASIDAMIDKGPFVQTWQHVWLGDSSGVLVATPLTLVLIDLWRSRGNARVATVLEVAILASLLTGLAAAAFEGRVPTIYLTLPLLMWAAMRFQLRGALPALGLLVVVSAIYSFGRDGVFADKDSVDTQIVNLQVFFAVAAVSSLFAAVLANQHQLAQQALRHMNRSLEQQVAQRTARLAAALRAGRLGVIEVDRRREVARLDPMVQGMFGQPGYAVRFAELTKRVNKADRERFLAELQGASARTDSAHSSIECRIGEGDQHWIVFDLEPLDGKSPMIMAGIVQDISERIAARRRQRLLIDELSHRVKNTLSMVQAIAMQTLGGADQSSAKTFLSRISAFARANDLLARQGWESASLDDLIEQAIAPFGVDRFELAGSGRNFLPAAKALAIALALHELSTNALKYGALSAPGGKVSISWELLDAEGRFRLLWVESGGPAVSAPTHVGFGSVLLQRVLARDLRGTVDVDFNAEGVTCLIDAPLPELCSMPADLAQDSG